MFKNVFSGTSTANFEHIFAFRLKHLTVTHHFFNKNSFYKNQQSQSCQKIKKILRIKATLKCMIKKLESPILILHQESALFTIECLLFTMEALEFRKTYVRNQHTSQSKHS